MEFDLSQKITDFSGFTGDELKALRAAAVTAMDPYRSKAAAEFSATDVDELETLRSIIDGADAERATRKERAGKAASLLAHADESDEDEDDDDDDEDATEAEAEKVEEPKAVTASAPKAPRVSNVAKERQRLGQDMDPTVSPTGEVNAETFARLVNGPGADGIKFGDWRQVSKAAERKLSSYAGLSGHGRDPLVVIRREFDKELITDFSTDAIEVLEYAGKESRLTGGSLTAAAGWCAPSTTLYDLCELETRDGLIDVPEVQVSRGGIRFTPGPDFAAIFGGSGFFHYTEAQVIAGVTKPCMVIPCPDFQDIRLDVDGLCITGSLLQRRGYPELVERFIRGALVAHAHKLSAWKIAAMVTGSTPVDYDTIPAGLVVDPTTTGILALMEWQVVDMRYRHRMALNATMEVVAPAWLLPIVRADFSRRSGVDMTNVTDAQINAHFTQRGMRVQWVYNWQDAYSGVAAGPGAATPSADYPNAVSLMIYPAGTWVAGVEDVIRLDTVYDSALLAQNLYTALFTEEGVLMAKPCGESRVVTIANICPSGATGSTTAFACA